MASRDADHLNILAICHWICAGIIALFSCIFIVHIVIGIAQVNGAPSPQMGPFFGWFFIIFGGLAVALGWTLAILTMISGLFIRRRRNRLFSLIVAGIDCLWFPFGTVLGVFTFIVLLRDSVRSSYSSITS
ncbi:MAG: hypothetical protein JO353_10035 [Phycisphaerae bacterium]|nr:hypothetical protein [Phycisphaerae bacterium]